MSRYLDLREFLRRWPYDPDQSVRLVKVRDRRKSLLARQPMGLEEYEVDGGRTIYDRTEWNQPWIFSWSDRRLKNRRRRGLQAQRQRLRRVPDGTPQRLNPQDRSTRLGLRAGKSCRTMLSTDPSYTATDATLIAYSGLTTC
jgi:hypothetical protein